MEELKRLYEITGIGYTSTVLDCFPSIEIPNINFSTDKQTALLRILVEHDNILLNKVDNTYYVGYANSGWHDTSINSQFTGKGEFLSFALADLVTKLWVHLKEETKNQIITILRS